MRIVLNQLNELLVQCLHYYAVNLRRGNMTDHLQQCPDVVISCSEAALKCPWIGKRKELEQHLRKYVFKKILPLIQELKKEILDQAKEQTPVCSQFRTSLNTTIQQLQAKTQLNGEQCRFICTFMNNGKPMGDMCIASYEDNCRVMNYFRNR